jgi:hypothetical protein
MPRRIDIEDEWEDDEQEFESDEKATEPQRSRFMLFAMANPVPESAEQHFFCRFEGRPRFIPLEDWGRSSRTCSG